MIQSLDDILVDPLAEGPLLPVETLSKKRQLQENVPEVKTIDLPLVSIGRPRVWLLAELLEAQSLPPTAQAILERESFFVVRFACSFRPRRDEVSVAWARFAVELLPDNQGRQPLAFDMYPRLVERERQVGKKVTLNPTLKFNEIEASVGEFGYSVEYPAVEPIVSASGIEEKTPSWDFANAPGYRVTGSKLLHAIVAAPEEIEQLEVTLSLTADLDYHGIRLPAWLGGGPTHAERAFDIVLWP